MSKGNPPIRLPKDIQAVLRILAAQKGVTVGEVLEEALQDNQDYQAAKKYLEGAQKQALQAA